LRYLFENYALDTNRRELHRGADLITITPQVFDLLDYLSATGSVSSAKTT
jgi:DNA-binding winged helix-turn-helix (wHTH) protein